MKLVGTLLVAIFFSALPSKAQYNVTVAKDGSGNFKTIQAAIDAAPTGRTAPYKIYIKSGTYTEVILVPSNKPFIQLIGQNKDIVIISFNNYNGKTNPAGGSFGTANSATFTVNANDFSAANISFKNSTGDKPQAVAMLIQGDRCAFKNCNFLGGQDTLCNLGNGKREYFYSCYVEGTVDFIFGNARAWFEKCTILPRALKDGTTQSYLTAANTSAGQAFGYVFNNCKINDNAGATKFFLGRPWQNSCGASPRSNPKVIFLNTTMGTTILPAGWSTWDNCTVTSEITYAEYKSKNTSGALTDVSKRVSWSKQLSSSQAGTYTLSNVMGSWNPCSVFADGCTVTSNYRMVAGLAPTASLDIKDYAANESTVLVYPNPVSRLSKFILTVPGAVKKININVVNANGRLISSATASTLSSITLTAPSYKGVYFITIMEANSKILFHKRIVVQ